MQEGRLIAFFNKILGQRSQLKSIYQKKLMAICLVVQNWKHYLLGRFGPINKVYGSFHYKEEWGVGK